MASLPDGDFTAPGLTSQRADVLRMTAGAALLSTTGIFVALAHVPPSVSALYRMLFGGAMLLVLVVPTLRRQSLVWRDLGYAVLPAVAFAVDLALWHQSIVYVGPGLATLLGNFQVFALALVGVVVYRERVGLRFVLGLGVALVGLWLLVGAHWDAFDVTHRRGVWLGLATGLAYAVYLLSMRRAQSGRVRLQPAAFLGVVSLLCAALLWVLCLGEGVSLAIPDAQSWTVLVALAASGQVLAWLLIVRAMPRLPASLVGLLLLLQPALAFLLDVALFKRPTVAGDWLGLALSLAGIFLGSWRRGN